MATIRSLLRDRVTLQVRSVDRIYLHAYVPKLMSEGMLIRFLLDRGAVIPSPALLGQIGSRYQAAIERFAERNAIPVVRFRRGESKEEVARPYLEAAAREGRFGCVMIGVAQERAHVWRGWRKGGPDGHPHFEFGRQSALPNHYYFYLYDREWGPAFWKCCCYAPYPVWLCLNGHEWAKRQAEQAGLSFEALDNGFRSTTDAGALAAICARLGARDVWASSAATSASCRPRFQPTIASAATATSSPCVSSSSPTPASSTSRGPAASGSSGRSATSSRSAAPTTSPSSFSAR